MSGRRSLEELRAAALAAADAALAAVAPEARVREALASEPLPGPYRVLALGKAAEAMCRAALGPGLRGGVAVAPAAPELPESIGPVRVLAGGHPLPDPRSAAAGEALLAEARALSDEETALVLLSGGASALAAAPVDGLPVEELARRHDELLRSGASIHEINAERGPLSRVHAGGLSAAIGERPALTLAISDVPDDCERDIGSAPMHEAAPAGRRDFRIVASGRLAAEAAAAGLRGEGLEVLVDPEPLEGPVADELARRCSSPPAQALLCHGEPRVRAARGGRGGRCSHAALTAAQLLAGSEGPWVFLALATDGRDGCSGSGGALVHSALAPASEDVAAALAARTSGSFLESLGALLPERPTGTNVADLWLLLRSGA